MILGIRPSLGYISYVLLNKSVMRFAVAMSVFCVLTVLILCENEKTMDLRFIKPSPFPPPLYILAPPSTGRLTPLDACSIEAATRKDPLGNQDSLLHNLESTKRPYRDVHVFLWSNTISSRDKWAYFVAKLRGVNMRYMDVKKMASSTPLTTWRYISGAQGAPDWLSFLVSSAGLSWATGGLVIPLGTVMMIPITIQTYGEGMGVVIINNGKVDPAVLAFPAKHPVLEAIFDNFEKLLEDRSRLVDSLAGSQNWTTHLQRELTKIVEEECLLKENLLLMCSDIDVLDGEEVLQASFDKDTSKILPPSVSHPSFFRFMDPHLLAKEAMAYDVFKQFRLGRVCPKTARNLERTVKEQL